MYFEPSTPVCKQQSSSSKGAASSMELAVVEAQISFSAHCIVLHRIALYQYNISYKNRTETTSTSKLHQNGDTMGPRNQRKCASDPKPTSWTRVAESS